MNPLVEGVASGGGLSIEMSFWHWHWIQFSSTRAIDADVSNISTKGLDLCVIVHLWIVGSAMEGRGGKKKGLVGAQRERERWIENTRGDSLELNPKANPSISVCHETCRLFEMGLQPPPSPPVPPSQSLRSNRHLQSILWKLITFP